MKAPKPFYNINHEKNLLQHSVKEIYDQFGGQRNYQDDRYTSNFDSLSRDRRDLSYGNPCHPPRAACAALHSYTGRSATGRNFITIRLWPNFCETNKNSNIRKLFSYLVISVIGRAVLEATELRLSKSPGRDVRTVSICMGRWRCRKSSFADWEK